jgi:RHS repeat-associated protein
VAESDLSGNLQSEYVFFDGERVARRDNPSSSGPVFYYFSDHLKTTDIVTDAQGNIKNESDFYPWGGELQFLANDSNHYKFTGRERDSESQLDYFGARYYSNGLGRFIAPDWSAAPVPVPYADLTDPQSLNQYSYVRNIPTVKVDADGHDTGTLEKIAQEVIDRVAKPLIESASEAAPAAGKLGAELLGDASLVVGAAVVVYQLTFPDTVGQSNAGERAQIQQASQERAAHNGGVDPQAAPEPAAASGGAMKGNGRNGAPLAPTIHGNDHATTKPTEGYSLRDNDTGEVLKYGETTLGTARYSGAYLKQNNARMVFEAKGTKKEMHKWQHDKISEYKTQHNGARPPLNKSDY